jgi:hypothetical protein
MTLAQLQTSIQALGYEADSAAPQIEFINQFKRRVEGLRRWDFLERENTTLVTAVGSTTVNLAGVTDLRDIDALRIADGTNYYLLKYLPQQAFSDRAHLDRDNGVPQYWTWANNTLSVYPRPDLVYTVTMEYLKYSPDLAVGTDVPSWPLPYHDILVFGPASSMAIRQRDQSLYGICYGQYKERLDEMTKAHGIKQRQTRREVETSGLWNSFDTRPVSSA